MEPKRPEAILKVNKEYLVKRSFNDEGELQRERIPSNLIPEHDGPAIYNLQISQNPLAAPKHLFSGNASIDINRYQQNIIGRVQMPETNINYRVVVDPPQQPNPGGNGMEWNDVRNIIQRGQRMNATGFSAPYTWNEAETMYINQETPDGEKERYFHAPMPREQWIGPSRNLPLPDIDNPNNRTPAEVLRMRRDTILSAYMRQNPGRNKKRLWDNFLNEFRTVRIQEITKCMLKTPTYANPGWNLDTNEVSEGAIARLPNNLAEVNWKRNYINMREIPPLLSQLPMVTFVEIFFEEFEEWFTATNDIAELCEAVAPTLFRLPELLCQTLKRLNLRKDVNILLYARPFIIGMNPTSEGHYHTSVTELVSSSDIVDGVCRFFNTMAAEMSDYMNHYDISEEVQEIGSIWVKDLDIWIEESALTRNASLVDMVSNVYSLLPNNLAIKFGKFHPLISAGLCAAECYWNILADNTLYTGLKGITIVRRRADFVHWLYEGLAAADRERWMSGDTGYFMTQLFGKCVHLHVGVLIHHIDSMSVTTSFSHEETIHDNEQFDSLMLQWPIIAEMAGLKKVVHIMVNNHHVFEVCESDLKTIYSKFLPRPWRTEPIRPRNYYQQFDELKVIGPKRKKGENRTKTVNSFLDIETCNGPLGHTPYLLVWSIDGEAEPWVWRRIPSTKPEVRDGHKRQVYDIMLDFKNVMIQHYIVPMQNFKRINHVHEGDAELVYIVVWAHNGAGFDWTYIMDDWCYSEASIIGSPKKPKGWDIHNISFRDFYLLMTASLDSLAWDWLGKHKDDHAEFDKITEETYDKFADEMVIYCKKDVSLLKELVDLFNVKMSTISTLGADGILYRPKLKTPLTAASLAWKIWEQCFNTAEIHPCPQNLYADVRSSYYGGKVYNSVRIPPKKGDGTVGFVYDVNSMYPHCMKAFPMPVRFIRKIMLDTPTDYKELPSMLGRPNVIRLIHVSRWRVHDGVRDFHMPIRQNDGLYYIRNNSEPSWRWECELEVAKDFADFEVLGYMEWEARDIYSGYVDYFYEKRKECKARIPKDTAGEQFMKKLLNTLYGKAGQKQYHRSFFGRITDIFPYIRKQNLKLRSVVRLHGEWCIFTLQNLDSVSHSGIFIQIPSYITARARCLLYEVELAVPVYYRDTDSVHTAHELPAHMVSPTELGKWKLEGVIKNAVYKEGKVYYMELLDGTEVMKAKGIPKKLLSKELYLESDNVPKNRVVIGPMLQLVRGEGIMIARDIFKVMNAGARRRWLFDGTSEMFDCRDEIAFEFKRRKVQRMLMLKDRVKEGMQGRFLRLIGSSMISNYPDFTSENFWSVEGLHTYSKQILDWLIKLKVEQPHALIEDLIHKLANPG
jgi:hypothetical protein